MKIQKQSPWMISPRSFIKLLGAEYELLLEAGVNVLAKFYLAAVAIVVIIFLSFGSIWFAINLLFHDHFAEITLSIFFALLFVCIYIFLLNTFSKEAAPGKNGFSGLSNVIRTGFIVFIAYIVAQPLSILAVGDRLQEQTNRYKVQVLQDHLQVIHTFYSRDITKLKYRLDYCKQQRDSFATQSFNSEIADLTMAINKINKKEKSMADEAMRKIDGNSFFLYRVQMASHYSPSWILCTLFIALFLFPGWLIYNISSDNAYFSLKKGQEKKMVMDGYNSFVKQYQHIFQNRHAVSVTLFSRFEDPPFKHIRKIDTPALDTDSFLKKYITAE